jgi:hypothetical protein
LSKLVKEEKEDNNIIRLSENCFGIFLREKLAKFYKIGEKY